MQCPQCHSHDSRKIGLSRHKRQRWLCKQCKRTYGDTDLRLVDPQKKAKALQMYAEGIPARRIERLEGVSHNSVLNWVRQEVEGKALQPIPEQELGTVEIDEMWSFVGSKKGASGCGGQ